MPVAKTSLWFGVLGGLGLVACQPNAPSPAALSFTAIPDQNTTELQEKLQPLADHLSQQLGVPVEYLPVRDYQASVELFRNGDVLLAWFGGLTGVQARQAVPGARAIAQGEEDPRYFSYFIAHRDTGLEPSEDFPEYFIRQSTGASPEELFLAPVGFSGSHDKTAELVESGQYQAGVLNFKVYDRRVAEGLTDPEVARVIWKTPTYADYNWTAHPLLEQTFGEGFTARLQETLVSIDDPALLAALPRTRLIEASNEDFESIRQVALELGMLR